MSTRSLVGGLTDMGTFVVYVHFDGYPEGRLPVLDAIIKRDGAAKALATLLMAKEGGWSSLDEDQDASVPNVLGQRAESVEGYGVKYTDAPEIKPQRFPEEYHDDSWAEYVYLIPEVGPIRWAAAERGTAPEEWNWKEHEIGEAV